MKEIISKRRKELGMTQQELADKLFISDKVVSKWETGKSIPDTSILVDLANALEITLDELLKTSNTNQVNMRESNTQMLKSKFNILLIVFFTIEILSALLIMFGRIFVEDFNNKSWPYILIGCGFVFELLALSYFFIRYNQLVYNYAKIVTLKKKYFNLSIWLSYPLVLLVTIIFIIWGNPESTGVERVGWSFLFGSIYFVIALILTLLNNVKKKKKKS